MENKLSETTAIGAIEQGDLLTIKKLHAHDANFLQNKYKGQTLLQIAINNSAIEIIQKLIELDNSLLAGSDESALKLAVISGNDEIIKLIESQTSIEQLEMQIASEIELLEHSQIKLREHIEQLEDKLSFEHVNGNTKKRKISDDTSGPSKVRKLESSSVTSQEETYLSEEVEIASFLGPKNLWHVDTGIIPSIEHNTDELALIGSSEIVEA